MNWIILVVAMHTSTPSLPVGAYETITECEKVKLSLAAHGKYQLESMRCIESNQKIY